MLLNNLKVLEIGNAHEPKRRFTEFCFKRLQNDRVVHPRVEARDDTTQGTSSKLHFGDGIPGVRTTSPGDEISETLARRKVYRARMKAAEDGLCDELEPPNQAEGSEGARPAIPHGQETSTQPIRRFYLSHANADVLRQPVHSGVRKSRQSPTAVFVEKLRKSSKPPSRSSNSSIPIERILDLGAEAHLNRKPSEEQLSKGSPMGAKQLGGPLANHTRSALKLGHSIHDPPHTWDLDSDQLADELAALALEFEPVSSTAPAAAMPHVSQPDSTISDSQMTANDDFVYETYFRTSYDPVQDVSAADAGLIVIEEEDQELWYNYANSDEEIEWDEEDPDSNGEEEP